MSIDSLARRMSEAAREDTLESVDVDARLGELYDVQRRRRVVKSVAGLVAAVAVGALTLGVISSGPGNDVQPAGTVRSLQLKEACPESDVVECLDAATVLVRGKTPYTFTLTPGLSPDLGVSAAPYGIDVYAGGQENGGVTILAGVEAADGANAAGAERLARWVAARGFLLSNPVTRGELDGLTTWSVEVRLAKRSGDAGMCNVAQSSCRPVLEQPDRSHWQTGMWDGMVNRYTFLDVPGLGTVAISNWVFPKQNLPWSYVTTVLDRQEKLVQSIDFRVS